MPHSQGVSNNPILSRINTARRIDNYFFKIHSNIVGNHYKFDQFYWNIYFCIKQKYKMI